MAETFDHRVLAALVQVQLNTTEAHLTPIHTGKQIPRFGLIRHTSGLCCVSRRLIILACCSMSDG
jgi:hypothetical protein